MLAFGRPDNLHNSRAGRIRTKALRPKFGRPCAFSTRIIPKVNASAFPGTARAAAKRSPQRGTQQGHYCPRHRGVRLTEEKLRIINQARNDEIIQILSDFLHSSPLDHDKRRMVEIGNQVVQYDVIGW